MSRIRAAVAQSLIRILDQSSLGRANFDVTYPKTGQKLMRLNLKGHPQFKFEIGESSGNTLFVHEAPGNVLKLEITGGLTIHEVTSHLYRWAERLPDEIYATNEPDSELDKLLTRLESEIERNVPDPDAHFGAVEIEDLRVRLDALSHRFDQLHRDNSITKRELGELKKLIDRSRKDLPVLPKGAWYRAALSKIVSVLKKILGSKEGREVLVSATKKLLGLE